MLAKEIKRIQFKIEYKWGNEERIYCKHNDIYIQEKPELIYSAGDNWNKIKYPLNIFKCNMSLTKLILFNYSTYSDFFIYL